MEKCGKTPKKVKRIKREKRMAKMNKQTKERNLSFKSLSRGWAFHVRYALSIVGTGYSGFFLNFLNPVIPFINDTEQGRSVPPPSNDACYGALLL